MIITGCKIGQNFKIHSPEFPYNSILYIGYTWKEVQKKYREQFGLERKHIDWIILGLKLEER